MPGRNLIRLYEEEILAHDLYVALGRLHPEVMPLQNIPHSEMRHREAIAAVLKADAIELPKPADGPVLSLKAWMKLLQNGCDVHIEYQPRFPGSGKTTLLNKPLMQPSIECIPFSLMP